MRTIPWQSAGVFLLAITLLLPIPDRAQTLYVSGCVWAGPDCDTAPWAYTASAGGGSATTPNYPLCCGYGVKRLTLPMSVVPESVTHFEASVVQGNGGFEDILFSVDPGSPCLDIYVDGTDVNGITPHWRRAQTGKSSLSADIELRYNSNSLPAALWTIKDGSGASQESTGEAGHYRLNADGMSQAIATVVNTAESPNFAFSGDSLGCKLTAQGVLTAGTNFGTVHVVAQTTNGDLCLVRDYYFDLGPCQFCGNGQCNPQILNNSVDVRFSLGDSRITSGQAFLQVKSIGPDPALGTPRSLHCDFIRPELEKIITPDGCLRQVRSLDRVVDILTNSAVSYSLLFYSPTNLLPRGTNHLYSFTNSPFETVTIELVGGDTNRVRVSDSLSAAPADYLWGGNGWTLTTGNGLRNETKTTTQNGAVRTEIRTISDAQHVIQSVSSQKWQTFSFGDRLIEEVSGSGAIARTNQYTYTENGLLSQVLRGDGSWDIYQYDAVGRQTAHFSPFLNSAPTTNASLCRVTLSAYDDTILAGSGDNPQIEPYTPRRVIESVLGAEVSRRYSVIQYGRRIDIECVTAGAAWNDPDNLFTTNFVRTDFLCLGQPWKIIRPDGTMQLFSYSGNPAAHKTVWTGAPDPAFSSVTDGTREDTWLDRVGRLVAQSQTDIASGLVVSTNHYDYDPQGRLTNTTYLDGTRETRTYDCCHLKSERERDGTMTTYGYDDLKRRMTSTRLGIIQSNTYDSVGNVLATTRIGTDGTAITTSQSSYNDAGVLTGAMDALNRATVYTNYVDSEGQSVRTTTYPDLGTRIETYARDGTLLKLSGTGVHPVRYDYGVESDGGVPRLYSKEIRLDANGNDTPEWTKSYTDMLGRNYKTLYAAASGSPAQQSIYNSKGQLAREIDPDGVSTLYQYNAKGDLEYLAIDMYGDGQLHKDGTNRITRTVFDTIRDPDLGIIRRTRTYVWPLENVDFPQLLSEQVASADGLTVRSTTWNDNAPQVSQTITKYAGNGIRTVTQTDVDHSSTVSTYQNGRLVSVIRSDANGFQVSSAAYGYDPHGRQNTLTDARNGTTLSTFDDADEIISTTTPAPAPGQSPQVTRQWFDPMGRIWKTTLPDDSSVTNEYDTTGELKRTYGSRTYPVEYTYDAQGRIRTMITWTNFATLAGAAVTTWNYDPYRGWLSSKLYADNKGPAYTYTPAGRLRSRTWARGIVTSYQYDGAGNLASTLYSDDTPGVTTVYDRLGRPSTVSNGTSITSFRYNDAGEVLGELWSGGPLDGIAITNGYDRSLRRRSISAFHAGSPLVSSTYGYDPASRLQYVVNGANVVTYGYLPDSALVESLAFWQNGFVRMTTAKSYDHLDRLTSISSSSASASTSFGYAYNSANQRVSITNFDHSTWVYQYDSLGQVVSGKKYWSDGTPVAGQQFEYAFDDIGNRIQTRAGGDETGANLRVANYTNNSLNQITSRDVPQAVDIIGAANAAANVTVNGQPAYRKGEYYRAELAFTNAAAAGPGRSGSAPGGGRRPPLPPLPLPAQKHFAAAGPQWPGVTNLATLNGATNLITGHVFIPQTPEFFEYDADGNLTNDGRWSYAWDAENRLVAMTSHDNAPAGSKRRLEFKYDYQGRRLAKIVSIWNPSTSAYQPAITNRFVYDGWNLIAQLDVNSQLVTSYVWGLDLSGTMDGAGGVGGLLMMNNAGQGTHYYAYDGNGNVRALFRANDGSLSAEYEYGPFGELLQMSGSFAKSNPFRFSTKYQDDESDLVYYGYRYYNPSTGRWISRDPITDEQGINVAEDAGGLNIYGFVADNPLNQVDDLGLALYAIDGTDTDVADRANPWVMIQQTSESPARYWPGPYDGPTGIDTFDRALHVYDQIEQDFCKAQVAGTDFTIDLTGWSRGSMAAAMVAKMINDLGFWCEPCYTLKHYQPVKVNWVGLFDAVAMTKDVGFLRSVPSNVAHFDHAIKTKHTGIQRTFPTWHFAGANERAFNQHNGDLTTHRDIGESFKLGNNDSYIWMKSQAVAAGVHFK